jgi:hypothetical protein
LEDLQGVIEKASEALGLQITKPNKLAEFVDVWINSQSQMLDILNLKNEIVTNTVLGNDFHFEKQDIVIEALIESDLRKHGIHLHLQDHWPSNTSQLLLLAR